MIDVEKLAQKSVKDTVDRFSEPLTPGMDLEQKILLLIVLPAAVFMLGAVVGGLIVAGW